MSMEIYDSIYCIMSIDTFITISILKSQYKYLTMTPLHSVRHLIGFIFDLW